MMDAVTKYVTSAIVLGGKSYTAQAIGAAVQAYLLAQADLDAAHTTVSGKQQTRNTARSVARALRRPLRDWAKATFGADSPLLVEFGFTPEKPADKTVETKAQAAQKGRATRKSKKDALAHAAASATQPTNTK
jgi:hypothetical protein